MSDPMLAAPSYHKPFVYRDWLSDDTIWWVEYQGESSRHDSWAEAFYMAYTTARVRAIVLEEIGKLA